MKWAVLFLRKPHPQPLSKGRGAFCFSAFMQEGWKNMKAVANCGDFAAILRLFTQEPILFQ